MARHQIIIVVAVVLLGGVAFGSWRLVRHLPRASQPATVDPAELRAAWILGVQTALTEFERDRDAAKARDSLLALRVNASDREFHQNLVFAFEALVTQAPDAEGRLNGAREQFFTHAKQP